MIKKQKTTAMFFSLPIDKLALIAAAGGAAGLTAIFYTRNNYVKHITKQDFFVQAVDKLKSHEGAQFILGTPLATKVRCRIIRLF